MSKRIFNKLTKENKAFNNNYLNTEIAKEKLYKTNNSIDFNGNIRDLNQNDKKNKNINININKNFKENANLKNFIRGKMTENTNSNSNTNPDNIKINKINPNNSLSFNKKIIENDTGNPRVNKSIDFETNIKSRGKIDLRFTDLNKSNEDIMKNKKILLEKKSNDINIEKYQIDRKNSNNYNNTIVLNTTQYDQNLFYENFLDRSQILKNQISRQKAQKNYYKNNSNIDSTMQNYNDYDNYNVNEGDYTDNTNEYLFLQTNFDDFSHQKNNSLEVSSKKKKYSK
jgi:hypothetical protein